MTDLHLLLQKMEEEILLFENILKKLVNETPQYKKKILKTALKLDELETKRNLLSWILRHPQSVVQKESGDEKKWH